VVDNIGSEPCKPVRNLTVAPSARLRSSRERLALSVFVNLFWRVFNVSCDY